MNTNKLKVVITEFEHRSTPCYGIGFDFTGSCQARNHDDLYTCNAKGLIKDKQPTGYAS